MTSVVRQCCEQVTNCLPYLNLLFGWGLLPLLALDFMSVLLEEHGMDQHERNQVFGSCLDLAKPS